MSAQCKYLSSKNPTQTRSYTLAKPIYPNEKLAIQGRIRNDSLFLDVYFETTEAAFSIQKNAELRLTFEHQETMNLKAYEMLESDAYHTCCDVVWLAKVAYFVPIESILPKKNDLLQVDIELDNRQKTFSLKAKKRRMIWKVLDCIR